MHSPVPTVDVRLLLPRSRGEALAAGVKQYFTGELCKRGHVDVRHASSGKCYECMRCHTRERQASNPAYREMQSRLGKEKHKRIKADPAQYEQLLASKRKSYKRRQESDPLFMEQRRVKQRAYIAAADHVRERKKVTHATYIRRDDVKQKRRAAQRITYHAERKFDPTYLATRKRCSAEWAVKNRGAANAKTAIRRAMRQKASPPWLDDQKREEIRLMYLIAQRVSRETGVPHEIDHEVPLTHKLVCGLHCPDNLQLLTTFANRSKGNKFTEAST